MTDHDDLRERIGRVDGGEITSPTHRWPYTVIFPVAQTRSVVWTTKANLMTGWLFDTGEEFPIALIGRYGLPRIENLPGIATVIRDLPLYFLGDCDPFDLLVYAWLRRHISIRYLGVSDAVVSALGVNVNGSMTIPLPEEEKQAMALLRDVWPEFSASVGRECAAMLEDGRKLEMEALASFRTRPVADLFALLQ